jgi:hypothetical protein
MHIYTYLKILSKIYYLTNFEDHIYSDVMASKVRKAFSRYSINGRKLNVGLQRWGDLWR